MNQPALTVTDFLEMKQNGVTVTALTAYDALFASLLDRAGIDLLLVGDSVGNVVQGRTTTIPVTLEQMIYHGEMVARAVSRAFVVVDMPFLTFQVNDDEAVRNAGLIMQKTGCQAVKLEGGVRCASTIRRIVEAGIPVVGHIGLTPQSVNVLGGYKVQGREQPDIVLDDAIAVEQAGACMVVLEAMPKKLAADITHRLTIPTIGIGAGPSCDGQILVTHDLLGLFREYTPSFVRKYADLAPVIQSAVTSYIEDVRNRSFPSDEESFE
ncbi:3-methyl-2-oxobutanoate hydroxymethyltransferase [Candidatus Latescibacterota bacterium]